MVRYGYYLAFVGVCVSGFLLTIDLARPLRFWHMLIENHTGQPMFKAWEPMSVGAWGLLIFGLFSFLASALACWERTGRSCGLLRSAPVRFLRRPRSRAVIARSWGASSGLFIAGYTGVLLAVTNRPIWADSHLLGLLFLVSGASTGAAALILLAIRRRAADPAHRQLAGLVRPERAGAGAGGADRISDLAGLGGASVPELVGCYCS